MTSAHDPSGDEEYLTPLEMRRALGVSPRTYRRYVASGVLVPHHRTPKGHARFLRSQPEQVQRPRMGNPKTRAAVNAP